MDEMDDKGIPEENRVMEVLMQKSPKSKVWFKPFSQFGSTKLAIFSMHCTETSFESWLDPYAYHPLLVPWRRHRLSRVREEAP